MKCWWMILAYLLFGGVAFAEPPEGTSPIIQIAVDGYAMPDGETLNAVHDLVWSDDLHGWSKYYDFDTHAWEIFVTDSYNGFITGASGMGELFWDGVWLDGEYLIDEESFTGSSAGDISVTVNVPEMISWGRWLPLGIGVVAGGVGRGMGKRT